MIIGPDGQPMGAVPASAFERPATAATRGRRARDHRAGRAAGEGDADRQHDPPAARGGALRAARRRQPDPAQGDPPGLDQGARDRAGARSWSRSSSGCRCRSPRTRRRRTPSCGSPRPSWSAGSRASSTASRPRSTPSRWPPGRSSSRCAAGCRRVRPGPEQPAGRRAGPARRHRRACTSGRAPCRTVRESGDTDWARTRPRPGGRSRRPAPGRAGRRSPGRRPGRRAAARWSACVGDRRERRLDGLRAATGGSAGAEQRLDPGDVRRRWRGAVPLRPVAGELARRRPGAKKT